MHLECDMAALVSTRNVVEPQTSRIRSVNAPLERSFGVALVMTGRVLLLRRELADPAFDLR
jgi:hypothetical protein